MKPIYDYYRRLHKYNQKNYKLYGNLWKFNNTDLLERGLEKGKLFKPISDNILDNLL